jgi:GH24 family phage-related lysozyme (muramidase)
MMEEVERVRKIEKEWNDAYQSLVDTLKWHEGYRAVPYYCMAGVLTIGHGHTIKKGEHFDLPMSRETADSLLRADLDAAISYVRRTTDLEHTQLLAIGHFVYALGSGNFSKSTLKKRIIADKPIDNEIVKWVHIRTKKGIVKSEYLRASRIMELNLYNLTT